MEQLSRALRILFISLVILGLFFLVALGYAIYQRLGAGENRQISPAPVPPSLNPLQLTPEQKADILQKLTPPQSIQEIPKDRKEELLKRLEPSKTVKNPLSAIPNKGIDPQAYQAKKRILEQISPK